MGRKKKFVIAASTFAAIFTTIFVVKRFRKRHELERLTPEEWKEVIHALQLSKKEYLKERLEGMISDLPESEWNLSRVRTALREWFDNHL